MTAPDIGDLEVEIRANLDDFVRDLQARLEAINRRQAIKLRVQIQDAALKNLNKNLKSFTGVNALTKSFQDAGDKIRGVFDNIGKVSRIAVGASALIGPLGVAVGALSTSIAALGPAAAGGLAGLAALKLGLKATTFVFKTAFEEIPPAVQGSLDKFKEIKKVIGRNFWEEATGGVQLLLKSALGPLKEGFGNLATAAGEFTSHLAGSLSRAFTPDVYATFFKGLTDSFKILDHSFTDPLANIAKIFVQFSAEVFPLVAQGIKDITIRLNDFLVANPTFLIDSFKLFVEVMKGVVTTIISIGRIFGALAKAAGEAGIGASNFAGFFKKIADTLNSVGGQNALVTFFKDAKRGTDGLATAMGPLGDVLKSLGPSISKFIGDSGVAVGGFLKAFFEGLNKPEVIENLKKGLEALPQIFTALTPVAGLLAEKFGALVGFGGTLAVEFSKNLASAIEVLLPIFTAILPSVEKLTKAMGEFFRTKIKDLQPQFEQVGEAVKGLIDGVTAFVEALNTPVLKFILGLITSFITTAISGFLNLAGGVLQVVSGLAKILSGDFSGFKQIFSGLGDVIKGAFQIFITLFAPAKILGLLGRLFPAVGGAVGSIVTTIVTRFATLINVIPGLGVRLMSALASRIAGGAAGVGGALINGITRGVQAVIGGLLVFLTEKIWEPVKSFFGIASPSKLFMELGGFLIEGLINGIKALLGALVDLFLIPVEAIKTVFTGAFDAIKSVASLLFDALKLYFETWKTIITTGIAVVQTVVNAVWDAIKAAGEAVWTVITNAFNLWKSIIEAGIAVVKTVVEAVWTALKATGEFLWQGVLNIFNLFKAGVELGIAVVKTVVTAVWTALKAAGEAVWTGIKLAFDLAKAAIQVGIAVLKAVVEAVWSAIKLAGEVMWTGIKVQFELLKSVVMAGVAVLQAVVNAVWSVIKAAGQAVWTAIQAAFNTAKGIISAGVAALQAVVTGVWNVIKSVGSSIWSGITSAFNGAKSAITGGVDAIKGKFTDAFNAIKEKVLAVFKTIKDKIPKISIPGLSKLPGFATGVTNFSGGLAVVGERGPEIVNLPRGSDVRTASASRNALREAQNGQGGFTINGGIVINEAGRAPADSLPRALRNLAFTMGAA